LGAVTFSKTRSLIVDLRSSLVLGVFKELVDSGSSDCFLDSKFVISNKLRTWEIDPLPLTLINGTVNCYINQVVSLPIQLPCGSSCIIECYVTTLNSFYELVSGHNWLREWNPTIDWLHGVIVLPSLPTPELANTLIAPEPQELLVRIPIFLSTSTSKSHISFINTSVYQRACKLQGATPFQLLLSVSQELTGYARQVENNSHDLSKIPVDYHQYAKVFSKERSKLLLPHRPYNLSIQLESKKLPPLGPIYSLSTLELQTLREFIDKNLRMGFIQPLQSSCGAPVLFIKKKDGSLRLCVDY